MEQKVKLGPIDVPTKLFEDATHCRLWVHYDKGDGYLKKRGYYFSVRPITKREINCGGVIMQEVSFIGVDDRARTYFLESAARKNPSRLEHLTEVVQKWKEEIVQAVSEKRYRDVWTYMELI